MSLDFTAVDFQTANSYRGSPCSVGLVRVRDGRPVESRDFLVNPPSAASRFDPWNIGLHGITPAAVASAPSWGEALEKITAFVQDDVVISHNAGFDIGVIRAACAADGIAWPAMRYLCTLVMSRQAWALPSYRLPYVVEALGLSMGTHHDALADALAVVDIVRHLSAQLGVSDAESLARAVGVRLGRMSAGRYRGDPANIGSGGARLVRGQVDTDADPEGYLYGRVVVITGTLFSMTRQMAWDECAKVGAVAELNTTKRTNVLVVGDIDPTVLRPGSAVTGKTRKAFELQDRGQKIEVMTEDDFLNCLDGEPLAAL